MTVMTMNVWFQCPLVRSERLLTGWGHDVTRDCRMNLEPPPLFRLSDRLSDGVTLPLCD